MEEFRRRQASPEAYSASKLAIEAEEGELFERLLQQDLRAFETLYDRYSSLVYSTALRIVSDPSTAEDVMQEVFLRLWRRPENYVPQRGRFVIWILSVTRNRAIDELRTRGRRLKRETLPSWNVEDSLSAVSSDDPAGDVQLNDERRIIIRALAKLPPEQRQPIELAYFRGLTQQEIANLLHQPLGTVKTRIRLGMQKLKPLLKDEEEE